MRKIFENTIFLIGQIVALIFTILWYLQDKEYEPLIVIIMIITTIIISIVINYSIKKRKRNLELIRNELTKNEIIEYNKIIPSILDKTKIEHKENFIRSSEDLKSLLSSHNISFFSTKEDIKNEIEKRTIALKERLKNIEKRFPEESNLEKLSSINDAILAVKIEEIQKYIKIIENKMLSKWDVAIIVFAIIGTFGALVGIAIAIINFIAS